MQKIPPNLRALSRSNGLVKAALDKVESGECSLIQALAALIEVQADVIIKFRRKVEDVHDFLLSVQ